MAGRSRAKTVDELLAAARAMLPHRPSPAEALSAQADGADLDGGFIAWAAAGLPVLVGQDVPADCHIGMTRATV